MGGFSDKVIGGVNKLIRSAIQSPNFVHAISGWSINKDGSAEFSDVDVRGTITLNNSSDAILVYDANGDLVFAITQDSTTLPAHTSNPIVVGDHLGGSGSAAFGVLSFKTPIANLDYDMFMTTDGSGTNTPFLQIKPLYTSVPFSPHADVFIGECSHGATSSPGIAIATQLPNPGASTSRMQFGNGYLAGYYSETVNGDPTQVIASGVTATLTNLSASHLRSDYGSGAFNAVTGVWTCPSAGQYTFSVNGVLGAFITGSRFFVGVRDVTSGNYLARLDTSPATSGVIGNTITTGAIDITTGQTIDFRLGHICGANKTVDASTYICIRRNL
jgi:hypothetical protein